MKIKRFKENVYPKMSSHLEIKEQTLIQVAKSIMLLCNGEYGITFWNKEDNHILICLGDSNPFGEQLKYYILEILCGVNYELQKKVKIEIQNEIVPTGEGWFQFNGVNFESL